MLLPKEKEKGKGKKIVPQSVKLRNSNSKKRETPKDEKLRKSIEIRK